MQSRSYLLLFILALILFFILGVRYGQKVEKTNKVINYLISLSPTQTPVPTQKILEFKTYESKICGIRFLYPSNLNVSESSSSAIIIVGDPTLDTNSAEIDCGTKTSDTFLPLYWQDTATEEAIFKNKKITIKLSGSTKKNIYIFKFTHPKNSKDIYVAIWKNLYPLFEKSIEFLP